MPRSRTAPATPGRSAVAERLAAELAEADERRSPARRAEVAARISALSLDLYCQIHKVSLEEAERALELRRARQEALALRLREA